MVSLAASGKMDAGCAHWSPCMPPPLGRDSENIRAAYIYIDAFAELVAFWNKQVHPTKLASRDHSPHCAVVRGLTGGVFDASSSLPKRKNAMKHSVNTAHKTIRSGCLDPCQYARNWSSIAGVMVRLTCVAVPAYWRRSSLFLTVRFATSVWRSGHASQGTPNHYAYYVPLPGKI